MEIGWACFITVFLAASGAGQTQRPATSQDHQPSYHITMVPRTTTAINYETRKTTEIGFQGSPLLPLAKGKAKVASDRGRIAINAEFKGLEPAQKFGAEYLTYVMWAITPEGKSSNLGEVLLQGDASKLRVTTSLQTFGLIVTAEPYFAVSEPSDAVVLENVVLPETTGIIQQMNASYQSLRRGQYSYVVRTNESFVKSKVPIEVEEARNAVQIARYVGAEQYASEAFNKAQQSLDQAEALLKSKRDKRQVVQSARDAVQNAADARQIAVRRREDEEAARERAAAAQRTAQAQAEAAAAVARQQQEELARQQADVQKQQAEMQARQEGQARAEAESSRQE